MLTWGLLAAIRFEAPGYLVLLGLIPFIVLLSFRSLAGLGGVRRAVALVARSTVVVLMVLALAGMHWVRRNDNLSVVFLIDRSSSVPPALQAEAFQAFENAQTGMRVNDRIGLVAFDGRATIEQLLRGVNEERLDKLGDPLQPDQTDLGAAVRLGMALFTNDTMRRLVLLSDGNENAGEVLEEARQFASAGVPIDVVPLAFAHAREVLFEQLHAPPTAAAEETVNLRMVLRSTGTEPVAGRIVLYHNDQPVPLGPGGGGHAVTLPPGPSALSLPVPLPTAGVHRFRAVFEPADPGQDGLPTNNEGRAFTVVSGLTRALIVTTATNSASAQVMQAALAREQLAADVALAGERPLVPERLLDYGLIMLDNVPAHLVTEEEQRALALYVREMGGGLIMVGGEESFGAGGWLGSPVEEVMPVSFDVKAEKQIREGALVLVMHACEIPQGNAIGERVAVAAAKTLSTLDWVGVLAWSWHGGDQQNWTVPFRRVGDKAEVLQMIRQMEMGDLPDLHAVMAQGVDALARGPTGRRHMIVISDFDPMFDYGLGGSGAALLRTMRENRISCTTVSIGWGGHPIDEAKAKAIAAGAAPGGQYYPGNDFSKLPQIFIKEAQLVRRSLVVEGDVKLRPTRVLSPVVAGLASEALPDLRGYVVTTPKPLAETALVTQLEGQKDPDPILAYWQAGLGKTVAFTSGMWTRWGDQWAGWPRFGSVWAQLARWASRQSDAGAFDVSTTLHGNRGRVRVEARDKSAAAVNFMNLEGTVITPDATGTPLRLVQTGPGRYEGEFDARQTGSYILNLAYRLGSGATATSGSFQTGLSVAYSPEYRDMDANLALLDELRSRTGGRELTVANAAAAFDRGGLALAETRAPVWEFLIRWMLVAFLVDVAVRRIAINPRSVARAARRRIAEMGGEVRAAESSAAVLTTLKGTRERAREGQAPAGEAGPAPTRGAHYDAPVTDAQATARLNEVLGGASADDQPVVAPPSRKPPSTSQADYTSRLLDAKRRARRQAEDQDRADGPERGA
jgi:uncharacterized membrane protein